MTSKPLSFSPAHAIREPHTVPSHRMAGRDPRPDDLGHEGFVSRIKSNTTDTGERVDRGD